MLAQISSEVRRFKVLVKDENEAIKRAIEVAGGRPYKLELWAGHGDVAGKPPDKVIEQGAFPFVEPSAQRICPACAEHNEHFALEYDEDKKDFFCRVCQRSYPADAQRFTILFGTLDNETLEVVWDDCGTGTYKTREDAEWFAQQYRKDGQVYEIKVCAD